MSVCPFADQSRRYDSSFKRQVYTGGPNKGLLHTTETSGLPGYEGGGNAPHFSVLPIFAEQRVVIYQHFDTDRPSRALRDLAGGVQTNNDGVVQIELIGTCTKSGPGLFWPEAPEWALAGVRELMAWIERDRGIPNVQPSEGWTTYPPTRSVRMGQSRWDDYAGWCGHQHVPENDHGDPGDMSALFEEDDMANRTDKEIAEAVLNTDGVVRSPDGASEDNPYWGAGTYLRYIANTVSALRDQLKVAARDAAVARSLAEKQAEQGGPLSPEEVAEATRQGVARALSEAAQIEVRVKAEPTEVQP